MSSAAPLTKKQQKALAFRAKQKAKKSGKGENIVGDVPEQDLIEEADGDDAEVAEESSSKKRKREEPEPADKAKAKGKGKAKTAWDEDEEGEGQEGKGKKSKKEVKQRFILFVGNLDFKTSQIDVQRHFQPAIESTPSVRLLTTKPTTPSQRPKSRGIAFLELSSSADMQACLKLHHSTLQNRRINVELTAGGGGKGEKRQGKIKERNERVGGQRERKAEKEREAGGGEVQDQGGAGRGTGGGGEGGMGKGKVEVVQDGEGAVKIRNGRRVRLNPKDGGNNGRSTGSPQQQRGGDRSRFPPGQNGPQRGFKRKFEPTGANALTVG